MNDLVFSTSMLFNTNNDNGCLKQIECDSFYIASYQRGYKWGDEPIQILFDDLYDAFKSSKNSKKSQEYYLQYITVKKIEYNKKNPQLSLNKIKYELQLEQISKQKYRIIK